MLTTSQVWSDSDFVFKYSSISRSQDLLSASHTTGQIQRSSIQRGPRHYSRIYSIHNSNARTTSQINHVRNHHRTREDSEAHRPPGHPHTCPPRLGTSYGPAGVSGWGCGASTSSSHSRTQLCCARKRSFTMGRRQATAGFPRRGQFPRLRGGVAHSSGERQSNGRSEGYCVLRCQGRGAERGHVVDLQERVATILR